MQSKNAYTMRFCNNPSHSWLRVIISPGLTNTATISHMVSRRKKTCCASDVCCVEPVYYCNQQLWILKAQICLEGCRNQLSTNSRVIHLCLSFLKQLGFLETFWFEFVMWLFVPSPVLVVPGLSFKERNLFSHHSFTNIQRVTRDFVPRSLLTWWCYIKANCLGAKMPNWNTYVQGLFMKCLWEKGWKPAQISDLKTPWRVLSQDRSERQLTNNYK